MNMLGYKPRNRSCSPAQARKTHAKALAGHIPKKFSVECSVNPTTIHGTDQARHVTARFAGYACVTLEGAAQTTQAIIEEHDTKLVGSVLT